MIQRKTYLAQLEIVCNQDLIKVVTGIRRCGKSTLMMEFQALLKSKGVDEKRILSLNFEERENSQFEDWRIVYDLIMSRLPFTEKKYVFLDEVQLIPHFEKLVDALYVNKDIDLYIQDQMLIYYLVN